MLLALLLSLCSPLALAQAQAQAEIPSGLRDTDAIVFSLVHTRAASEYAKPVAAPALCLIGTNNDGSSKGLNLLLTKVDAPTLTDAHPCDFMRSVATNIEEVRTYPAASMVPGFWHESRDNPLPHQFTFEAELKGADINASLVRLRAKCAASAAGCENYSLILVRNNGGLQYRLPLENFKVTPAAKTATYHPRDGSFSLDNYSVHVVPRAE